MIKEVQQVVFIPALINSCCFIPGRRLERRNQVGFQIFELVPLFEVLKHLLSLYGCVLNSFRISVELTVVIVHLRNLSCILYTSMLFISMSAIEYNHRGPVCKHFALNIKV